MQSGDCLVSWSVLLPNFQLCIFDFTLWSWEFCPASCNWDLLFTIFEGRHCWTAALNFQWMLMCEPFFRNTSVPAGPIEGVNIRVKNDVVKMPNGNCQAGKNRFVIMNGQGDINSPARQELCKFEFEPNHQSGEAHDDRSP